MKRKNIKYEKQGWHTPRNPYAYEVQKAIMRGEKDFAYTSYIKRYNETHSRKLKWNF